MEQEIDRVDHLASFALDYSSYHQELSPFVKLAQEITDSPVCEINIIDAYNQWTIARTEEELKVIPREESVCMDTIQESKPYEVRDLKGHTRYSNRSYVAGEPYFRYYCGVQLTTDEDINIGSICVLDQETKEITNQQKEQLEYLADLVVQYLQKDRLVHQSNRKVHKMEERFRTLNHDIRNPINGIVGIVDLLMTDEGDEQIEVSTDDLQMIKDCANAIVGEIDRVLSTDEQEGVVDGVDKKPLKNVFEQVQKLNIPSAKRKDINFRIERKDDADYYISPYSAKQLVQIINNLVANGIKFTGNEGTIKVIYTTEEVEEQSLLKIMVEDDGIGMDEDKVESFNSGEKVFGSSGTEGEESFGIGLHHVRRMVAELDGNISVESNPGEGTQFTVTIAIKHL